MAWAGYVPYFNPRSHCRERRWQFRHERNIPDISIHVPIAGNDFEKVPKCLKADVFQSTFPLQGTTPIKRNRSEHICHFNPRSHCRERLREKRFRSLRKHFNPRSHCRERQIAKATGLGCAVDFNPRSHCRERRCTDFGNDVFKAISIHVPIAGND